MVPAGFAVRGTLTVPLVTLAGLADRPGELGGIGPDRPVARPESGRRGGPEPGDDLVRDGDRRARARGGARLRPACIPGPRETQETGNAGRDKGRPGGVQLHRRGAGRPAGRVRDLAAAHPRRRAGPDHRALSTRHGALRSHGSRPRGTIPGSGSGTWPRSGTPPVPARSAAGPPRPQTSSITSRTKPAAGRACAMRARSVSDNHTGGARQVRPGDQSSGSNLSRCPLGRWRGATT